jgi:hypothetical protein
MLLDDVSRILPREDNESGFVSVEYHVDHNNGLDSFSFGRHWRYTGCTEVKRMSLSQDYNNLFRRSDIADQLRLMESLLDSKDLTPAQAIALLNIIRVELDAPQPHRSSIYRRYAQVMQSLRSEMPEVHEQVVQAWEAKRANLQTKRKPAENLAGSLLNLGDESTMNGSSESTGGYGRPPEKASQSIPEQIDIPELKDESAEGSEVAEGEREEPAEKPEEDEERPEIEKEEHDEELEEEAGEHISEVEKIEPNEEDEEVEQEESQAESMEESEDQLAAQEENKEIAVEEAQSEPDEEIERGSQESSENRQTEGEAEGGERAATEAAEAAEHMQPEPEEVEVPGEEEPPIEAEE